jgi:hypothetical protein
MSMQSQNAPHVEYFAQGADALGDQVISYTLFQDVGCARKHERVNVSWLEFARGLATPKATYLHKKACPLISGCLYGESPSEEGSFKTQGNLLTLHLIEGDHDAKLCSFEQAVARLRAANVRCVIHTTASHKPGEDERWHVILPLSEWHSPGERAGFVGRVNRILEGVLAPESWRSAQGFFVGSVRGVEYRGAIIDGRPLDLAPEFEPLACQLKAKTAGPGADEGPGFMTDTEARAAFAAGANRRNAMLHLAWKWAREGRCADEILRELHGLLEQSPDRQTNAAHYVELRREAALIAVDRFEKFGLKFKSREQHADASSAPNNTDWPQPEPFTDLPTEPAFPLDALPPLLREATAEVVEYIQCPVALVANSVLAAASLGACAHLNVIRGANDLVPTNLFLLAIAQSGERKTSVDTRVFSPVRAFAREEADRQAPFFREAQSRRATWIGEREALRRLLARTKGKLAEASGEEERTTLREQQRRALADMQELERAEPPEPWPFSLFTNDFTREGLNKSLALGHPIRGIVDSEALAVLGGIGASDERFGGMIAMLSKLWDARDATHVERATTASYVVDAERVRVVASLMLQPEVLRQQVAREGAVARLSGFLARFMTCHPVSRIGTRELREAGPMPALAAFQARVIELLGRPMPTDENTRLAPQPIALSREARALWRESFMRIETSMGHLGDNDEFRDFGSKASEQALRIAGVLHALTEPMFWTCPVSAETMRSAVALAEHYLISARIAINEFLLPATGDAWTLWRRFVPHAGETLTGRQLHRVCRGAVARDEERLNAALKELESRALIRQATDNTSGGRPRKLILVRPDAERYRQRV